MTDLSPAAQAVLDATYREMDYAPRRHVQWAAAAALRAAADQWKNEIREQPDTEFICGIKNCIDALNDIVAELEAQ